MSLQIIASLVVIILLYKVWTRFRDRTISFRRASFFTLIWFSVALIFWQPEIASRLADYFGVGRGADLIVYSAIVVLAYISFRIFVKIDKMDQQITKLVKEIALHEEDKGRNSDR